MCAKGGGSAQVVDGTGVRNILNFRGFGGGGLRVWLKRAGVWIWIPACAGMTKEGQESGVRIWIPACAGMTSESQESGGVDGCAICLEWGYLRRGADGFGSGSYWGGVGVIFVI